MGLGLELVLRRMAAAAHSQHTCSTLAAHLTRRRRRTGDHLECCCRLLRAKARARARIRVRGKDRIRARARARARLRVRG